jgi:hypothetical protein
MYWRVKRAKTLLPMNLGTLATDTSGQLHIWTEKKKVSAWQSYVSKTIKVNISPIAIHFRCIILQIFCGRFLLSYA